MNLDPIMAYLGNRGCFHGMSEAETQRIRSELEGLLRAEIDRSVKAELRAHAVSRFQSSAAKLRKAALEQGRSIFAAGTMIDAAKALDAQALAALAPPASADRRPGVLRRLWHRLF